jgi:replicative DNA helicase
MLSLDQPQVQPHDLEAEQGVLGAILHNSTALSRAQEILTADDFYDTRHGLIFEAMVLLAGRSEAIDLITVSNQLNCAGQLERAGGTSTVAELLLAVATSANIQHHARIVHDCALRRKVIRVVADVSDRAYGNAPIDELRHEAQSKLFQLFSGRDEGSWRSISEISMDTVDYIDQLSKRSETLIGIPTGFETLNTLLGGWQRSNLIIVAGRTSMGKTALALGSALAAAQAGYRVGLISIEMSCRELGLRLHGMGAPIDVHALKTGSLSRQGWVSLAAAAEDIEKLPLWIDDASFVTVEQIMAKAHTLRATHGLDLLVVDYLQLLNLPFAESKQQGIADASRKLKLLAKELDIPVLVLSQCSRDCERRDDNRPVLADLRDSGAIEQDADVVLFVYREEVYRPHTDERGVAEILIRKHRNGPTGDRRLTFIDKFAMFQDLPLN